MVIVVDAVVVNVTFVLLVSLPPPPLLFCSRIRAILVYTPTTVSVDWTPPSCTLLALVKVAPRPLVITS